MWLNRIAFQLAFISIALKVTLANPKVRLVGESSVSKTVNQGDTVTLECQFDSEINCAWTHGIDSFTNNILNNRYSYVRGASFGKDCSLRLQRVDRSNDSGVWSCGKAATGQEHGREYMNVTVIVRGPQQPGGSASSTEPTRIASTSTPSDVSVEQHPGSRSLAAGSSYTLFCVFNTPVHCVWRRNGHRLRTWLSEYRYDKYQEDGISGQKECSLRINHFKEIDAGTWRCASLADDSHRAVLSDAATLTMESSSMSNSMWIIGLVIGMLILAVNVILVAILYQRKAVRLRSRQGSFNKL